MLILIFLTQIGTAVAIVLYVLLIRRNYSGGLRARRNGTGESIKASVRLCG